MLYWIFWFGALLPWIELNIEVRSVSFDGKMLDVSYSTGGGCSDHSSDVELAYDKTTMTVNVKVADVADKPDFCEALIPGSVKVDLKALVAKFAKDHGIAGNTFMIQLPQVMVTTF